MTLTQQQVDRNAHIPTSEIERDISDTEAEIATMRREIEGFRLLGDRWSDMRARARETGIEEREAFIAQLRALLTARAAETPAADKNSANCAQVAAESKCDHSAKFSALSRTEVWRKCGNCGEFVTQGSVTPAASETTAPCDHVGSVAWDPGDGKTHWRCPRCKAEGVDP